MRKNHSENAETKYDVKQKKKQLQYENGVATVFLSTVFTENVKQERQLLHFPVFNHTSLCSLLQLKRKV